MENNPFGPSSFETPPVSPDTSDKDKKTSKKKSTVTESEPAEKRQKVERDIARSFDASKLFETPKPDKTEAAIEAAPETISSEESQHIAQEIAGEHLQAIEQADPVAAEELAMAAEFLQRIQAGADSETAFVEVATELGLSETEINEAMQESVAEDEPAAEAAGEIDTAATGEGEIDWSSKNPTPPSGGSGGSGGRTPPTTGGIGGPSSASGFGGGAVPRASTAATPNMLPPAANGHYEQRRRAGELLVVGLVGYLIGRRRGRIKTEKRLLPVQRKLEKQVRTLEADLTRKEQLLVSAKANRSTPKTVEVPAVAAISRQEKPVTAPVERTQHGRQETRLGLEKPQRVERLGHMVIASEAPQRVIERPNNIRQAFRAEAVPTMQRNELLEVSEKIIVEGASLRRIYESNLIGEKQLRHLVSEYLNGKDIRKDLRREMVEREIDFERDPIMRDRVRSRLASADGGGGLNELLEKAGLATNDEEQTFQKRLASDKRYAETVKEKQQHQRVVVDVAMATAIVVLAIVVMVLVTRR